MLVPERAALRGGQKNRKCLRKPMAQARKYLGHKWIVGLMQ